MWLQQQSEEAQVRTKKNTSCTMIATCCCADFEDSPAETNVYIHTYVIISTRWSNRSVVGEAYEWPSTGEELIWIESEEVGKHTFFWSEDRRPGPSKLKVRAYRPKCACVRPAGTSRTTSSNSCRILHFALLRHRQYILHTLRSGHWHNIF